MHELTVSWTNGYHHTSGHYVTCVVTDDATGAVLFDSECPGPMNWCALGEAIGDAVGRGEEAIDIHIAWCIGLHKELRDG